MVRLTAADLALVIVLCLPLARPAGDLSASPVATATARALPTVAVPPVGTLVVSRSRPAASSPSAAAVVRGQDLDEDGLLGFAAGEERRYALESERLEPGEFAVWRLELETLRGEGDEFTGVFVLEHESALFARRSNVFDPDEIFRTRNRVVVRVNRHGFPLRIDYRRWPDRTLRDREDREIHAIYEAVEDRYRVLRPHAMSFRERHVYLPEHDQYDPSIPRGAFLSSDLSPGLLALAFHDLGAAGDEEVEFLAVAPTAMGTSSRGGLVLREGNQAGRPRRGRYRPPFVRVHLVLQERTTTGVGPETVEVLRYRRNRSDKDLFVSLEGTPLKLQTTHRGTTAWIRLLHPSEY